MIFRFTREEEDQLFKISDDLRAYVDSKKPADDKMIDTAMTFSRLLLEIEQKRREQIRTPEEILQSAKELINDCFLYEYAAYLPSCENSNDIQVIELSDKYISEYDILDCLSWSDKYKRFIELLNEQPQEPKLVFKEKTFKKLITQNIVLWHIGVLKGLPAAQDLEELINDCLEDSKYIYHEKGKKEYRTTAKAKEKGAITEEPKNLVVPTLAGYQYSMSLNKEKDAYIELLRSIENLEFKDGRLYFKGGEEVSEAELRDLRTNEGIEDLDLLSLRYYYSILLYQYQLSNVLQDIIVVSVPVLAGRKNPNEEDIKNVIEKIKGFHNVMGVIKRERNGKLRDSYYQVLNFEYYDEKNNIVAFSSPYMNYVIQTIDEASIRKDKKGKPKLKSNGEPLRLPSYSYMVKREIEKERNRVAAENVILIVQGLEAAGGTEYHFLVKTLIERNVILAKRLEENPVHKTQILRRTFKKTWELLRSQTRLYEYYTNIVLPDPGDPKFIPTAKNMDSLKITIRHEGKVINKSHEKKAGK